MLTVRFFEKKRRKAGGGLGWFTGTKGEEEICWERWSLEVTLATPKTEAGEFEKSWQRASGNNHTERAKVMKSIGSTLQKAAMRVVTIVNREKEHIPPITTSEMNPFPYSIDISPKIEGWGRGFGKV